MQKPPRFGEKIAEFSEHRERLALEAYQEFVSRKGKKRALGLCKDLGNCCVFGLEGDSQGLHTKFGLKTPTQHYLSAEETFFLACRQLVKQDPVEILRNSGIHIQKILIYSFFKRKGLNIPAKDTSLCEALEINLQISPEKIKNGKMWQITNPDDLFNPVPGEYYINCEGSYEKFQINVWDFK